MCSYFIYFILYLVSVTTSGKNRSHIKQHFALDFNELVRRVRLSNFHIYSSLTFFYFGN